MKLKPGLDRNVLDLFYSSQGSHGTCSNRNLHQKLTTAYFMDHDVYISDTQTVAFAKVRDFFYKFYIIFNLTIADSEIIQISANTTLLLP